MSQYLPLSYWVIVGTYTAISISIIYFSFQRVDCFSCSIATGLRRSALLALLVTPSVIPSWVLIPVPASLLFLMLAWSTAVGAEDFTLGFFLYSVGILCVLPLLAVASVVFITWALIRKTK